MSKWIPLMALAIVALVGALFLTQGSSSDAPGAAPEAAEQDELVPDDLGPATLEGPGDLRGPSGEAPTVPLRNAQRERLDLNPDITMAEAGGDFQVLVTDPKRKQPVEGMNVFLLDRSGDRMAEWRNRQSNPRDLRELMIQSGVMAITDAQGIASFQRVLNGAILAEGKGFRGTADWIGPVESPLPLALLPQTELEVYVLDDEDKIQPNVPVWIGPTQGARWLGMLKRATGPDGMAKFDGVSAFVNRATKDNPLGVFPGFPHLPRQPLLIDPEYLPEEPLELRMPPSGPLTIQVVDANGAPMETNLRIELGVANSGEETTFASVLSARTGMGEATFPHVGVDCPLQARLSGVPELANQIFAIRGPVAQGTPSVVTLRWDQQKVVFVGQALTQAGAVANRSLRATWADGKNRRSIPTRTDAQGNFRIVADGLEARSLKLFFPPGSEGRPLEANPKFTLRPQGGEHDLGQVYFDGLPALFEGMVVDSLGAPVPGAHVRVETFSRGDQPAAGKGGESKSGERGSKGGREGGRELRGGGESSKGSSKNPGHTEFEDGRAMETGWRSVSGLNTVSGADGSFVIYGRVYSRNLRLVASRRGFQPGHIREVKPGGPPLRITLTGDLGQINANEEAQRAAKESRGQ